MADENPSIADLNDALRTQFEWGQIVATRSVSELRDETKNQIMQAIQTFSEFTPDNDPYGEHDFWSVVINGEKFFWKIDYYNKDMTMGSENPANPDITQRVMTIMQASEY